MGDGEFNCQNRADEEAFEIGIGNSSFPMIDLKQVLKPCNTSEGELGFECRAVKGSSVNLTSEGRGMKEGCLILRAWCSPHRGTYTCENLIGKTRTAKTIDHIMCSNQTFWEGISCGKGNFRRCTGITPGQCWHEEECTDGSNSILPAQGGNCGKMLRCTAHDQIGLDNRTVCIEDKYKCDGILHCKDKEDEKDCPRKNYQQCGGNVLRKCIGSYKMPDGDHCKNGDMMCTARDGRWAKKNICLGKKFLCDNHLQCEDGRDEMGCEKEYMRKGLHRRDHHHICRSPFLGTKAEDNRTGRFFPFRAIRWFYVIYTHSHGPIIYFNFDFYIGATRLSSVHMAMMKLTAKFLISCVLSGVCFSFSH